MKLQINYKKTECPICKTKGEWIYHDEDYLCEKCGFIIQTPYHYTAGIKINMDVDFKIERIKRGKK